MLTLTKYVDLMRHKIGGAPDSRVDLTEVFNRAGRALTTAHDWAWRERGPATVVGVAGADHLELPADYMAVRECYIDNTDGGSGTYTHVAVVSRTKIAKLRESTGLDAIGTLYVYFPHWATQATAGVEPRPRALVYPRIVSATVPTLNLLYQCRWTEVTDVNLVPNIPLEFEHALVLLCRSMVCHLEDGRAAIDDAEYMAEIERLKIQDGDGQWNMGQMEGGVNRYESELRYDNVRMIGPID